MRTVLIHCHLFKNAGTTLDWSLRRHFGDRFIGITDDLKRWRDPENLSTYLLENEGYSVVSSHHFWFPMPVLEGVRILPVVMLRHPIDRVGSVYEFQVRQESSTPGAVHAKKMTFEHYVRWGMDPTSGATIRDFQTRRCCGRFVKTRARVTEQDFALALQQVQGIRLLGLVDRYDESMVLFEQVLQPFFPAINLAYVKHNVSTSRRGTLQERVQHVYDRLGAEVGAILQENNYWDQKLYEEAEALLSKRMAAFPDFENKLKDFRERCRRLRILTFGKRFIQTWWTGIKARYPDR